MNLLLISKARNI